MPEDDFLDLWREKIADYYGLYPNEWSTSDIYAVWVCKILQNNKALLSTNTPDGLYFECTYNGDKNELYFDVYKRQKNSCYKVSEID